MDSTQQGWLSRILHAIENFFTGAQDEIHKIATEASTITNNIKAWASSPAGITIENIVADLVPPELTLAFKDWLPTLFKDLNFATNAADYLTDDHIIQQGLAYLNSLTGNARATQLNSLSANIAAWKALNQGAQLTIQQALTLSQTVYHDAQTIVNAVLPDANVNQAPVAETPATAAPVAEAPATAAPVAEAPAIAAPVAEAPATELHPITGYPVPVAQA